MSTMIGGSHSRLSLLLQFSCRPLISTEAVNRSSGVPEIHRKVKIRCFVSSAGTQI